MEHDTEHDNGADVVVYQQQHAGQPVTRAQLNASKQASHEKELFVDNTMQCYLMRAMVSTMSSPGRTNFKELMG